MLSDDMQDNNDDALPPKKMKMSDDKLKRFMGTMNKMLAFTDKKKELEMSSSKSHKRDDDIGMDSLRGCSNWLPINFKAVFKDHKLRDRLGIVVVMPSGVDDKDNVNAKIERDGMAIQIKVRVSDVVTDPKKFLLFSKLPLYKSSMNDCNGFRIRAFHEALAKERKVVLAAVWRDFVLDLDFPVTEDIPIVELLVLEGCFYLYLELVAKEKLAYMDNNGRLTGRVLDLDAALNNLEDK